MEKMRLTTKRLTLRPLKKEDAPELFSLWNDEDTVRYLVCTQKNSVGACRRWIKKLLHDVKEPNAFVICLDEKIIGVCGTPTSNNYEHKYGLYYEIHKRYRKNGYAREAVQALLEHAFSTKKAKYVETYVAVDNTASVRLLENLGFKNEAKQENGFIKQGIVLDEYRFRMTKESYDSKRSG